MSKLIGELGENCASEYLRRKGYDIVKRNYYSRYGEIDIIASNQEYIVFVEVKTRRLGSLISGAECVGKSKQRKIVKTYLDYMQNNQIDLQVRFDVIEVEFESIHSMFIKNHIANAFIIEEGQYAIF